MSQSYPTVSTWHNIIKQIRLIESSVLPCLRYDLALIYLEQAKYNLDLAVEAYLADETWEKRNPIDRLSEEKSKQRQKRQRRLTRGH